MTYEIDQTLADNTSVSETTRVGGVGGVEEGSESQGQSRLAELVLTGRDERFAVGGEAE